MEPIWIEKEGRPRGWFEPQEGALYLDTAQRYPGGVLVEVGCFLGKSLSFVLEACRTRAITVYAVDHWKSCPLDQFKENLQRLGATAQVKILHSDSVEASQQFADESVDIMMLDSDHRYEPTLREIEAWWPKIKLGGTFLAHDYSRCWAGVVQAINERFLQPDDIRGSLALVRKTNAQRKQS